MEQSVQMCYGLGTVKVQGITVATTFKTKVAKYGQSFAYLAFKQVSKESNGLIRIDENGCKKASEAMVTAVATGERMAELSRLVQRAKILQLECQLAMAKNEPLPVWVRVCAFVPECEIDLPF